MANFLLNDAARVALAVLLNSLWQGALIAFVAWGVLRIFSHANAATRYAIWALALVAMIVIPFFTSLPHVIVESPPAHTWTAVTPSGLGQTHGTVRASIAPESAVSAQHASPIGALPRLNLSLPLLKVPTALAAAVFVTWALAALFVLARLIVAIVSLERLKRDSLPLDVAYRDQMPQWNAAVKDFRDVRICLSDSIEVPVAVGLFDAMILLPRQLVASLDPGEIDQIALHELGHLRRNDDWTNALQRVACSLMFFNPAAWFVSRQLDLEREVACDDYVLQTTGAARSYAFCLTRIAEVTSWPQRGVAAPGVFITRRNISIRIERLLRSGRTIGSSIAPEIAATVAVALVLVSVLLRTMTPSVAYTLPAVKEKSDAMPTLVKVVNEPRSTREKATQKVNPVVSDAQAAPLKKVAPMPPLPKAASVKPMEKVAELPPMPEVQRIAQDASRAAVNGEDIGTAVGSAVASAVSKAVVARNLENVCTGCDYSDSDLHGHDFAHQNLNGANFQSTNLHGANFDHAKLTGANFSDADLRDASFAHADLLGCNLEGSRLSGARFEGARLTGCNVDAQDLSPVQAREFLISCLGCNFDSVDLHGMDLRNLHIKGVNLDGADLRGADLSGSTFTGVNLDGAKLTGAKLDGAKFYGCNFDSVDFHNVDVSKATFLGSSRRDVREHSFLQSPTGHGRAHLTEDAGVRVSHCDEAAA